MRHNTSAHLLGIPDLPEEAFKHYGDRKIKPQGFGSFLKKVTGGAIDITKFDPVGDFGRVLVGPGHDPIQDISDSVDNFVKKTIPGGWGTVVGATALYFGMPYIQEALGVAEGAAAAGEAAIASGSGGGATALGIGSTGMSAGYSAGAGTGAFSTASAFTGVEAASAGAGYALPAAETSIYSLSGTGSSSGLGMTATTGEGLSLAAPSSGTGMGLTSTPNLASMGGGQGLTTAAFGGGTVSELGTFGAPSLSDAYTTKELLNKDKEQPKEEEKEENKPLDLTAAFASIGSMLASRNSSTWGQRNFATGGDVLPTSPTATLGKAEKTEVTSGMKVATTGAGTAETTTGSKDVTATGVTTPEKVTEEKITADKAQQKITESLTGVKAEQGTVSEGATAEAVTVEPTKTAVGDLAAAQGKATLVQAPADRTLQAGELVSGSAVDQKAVEAALAKTQAAQGTVTEEMTTQGQLNKLLTNFDAGKPPPWAAASMRGVTAQLAARGLGASSMAGQAVIQATLEAAMPIAAADAKVFEQMGLQNLSNRQQTAMVLAEQRAKFLGQEFDQNFQTKVLNAARIADIADKNFTADVTIALENARLTNTMDLQNLSNRQAMIMAKTAQIANLETTNLNNRQQVAVENAKAFLAMDIKNLDNRQQTALFKAKEIADSILTDTAAANAAKATNATNALEADKVNAQLALSASQYNAAEKNKVAMFNKSAADELLKFNAQERNDRAEFNANLATQINIANAKVLADISTANTREVNAMAAVNAKNATDLSASTYAQLSQTYRDKIEQAWKTSDNNLQRASELAKTTLVANATKYQADSTADSAFYAAMGQLAVALLTTGGSSSAVSTVTEWIKKKF